MSILIKGMDMPKSCSACPFRQHFAYDDEIACMLKKDNFLLYTDANERRHKDCPIIHCPDEAIPVLERWKLENCICKAEG